MHQGHRGANHPGPACRQKLGRERNAGRDYQHEPRLCRRCREPARRRPADASSRYSTEANCGIAVLAASDAFGCSISSGSQSPGPQDSALSVREVCGDVGVSNDLTHYRKSACCTNVTITRFAQRRDDSAPSELYDGFPKGEMQRLRLTYDGLRPGTGERCSIFKVHGSRLTKSEIRPVLVRKVLML